MPLPKQIVLQEHPITAIIDSILDPIVRIAERKIQSDKSDRIQLAGLLERETVRKQSELDEIDDRIESEIKELQTISGVLFSLPEDQQTEEAALLHRDLSMPIVEGFQQLSNNLESEKRKLNKQLDLILKEVGDAKLVQDWFSGIGHRPEGGIDKFRHDIGEFTHEELDLYLEEYAPHIKTEESRNAFVKGAISKGRKILPHVIMNLNEVLDKAKTSELNTKISEYNYKRTLSGATREDMKALQESRDEDIYNLIKPFSITAGNTGLNRAIMTSGLGGLAKGDKGYDDALKVSNINLEMVGASITYNVKARKSNLELGAEIVSGNMRFQSSSEQETQLSRTDYTGLTRSYEKIYHHALHNEKRLGDEQLKDYKRRLSEIVGMRYDYFMNDFYPSLERGLENQDKDALSLTTGTLNTAVSGTGYSTFDEEFRDLYRNALVAKEVSGKDDFIKTNMGELWKLAKDKYGVTQEDFARYLEGF